MGANWGKQNIERERDCRIEIERDRRERSGGQNRKYTRNEEKKS